MSLLRHFVTSDVRRVRMAIALWILVTAAQTATTYAVPLVAWQERSAETLSFAGTLLWFGSALLSYALISFVIHTHPAVGSEAFWMTRPFPPRTLAGSKLLIISVLFVGVPVVFEIVLMAAHGVMTADMIRVALQTALIRGLIMAALISLAALTRNFARFALATGALVAALALVPPMVMLFYAWLPLEYETEFIAMLSTGSELRTPLLGEDPTAAIVGLLIIIAEGTGCVLAQYSRRRVRRSVLIAVGGLFLAIVVTIVWPFELLRQPAPPPEWAQAPAALQLSADASSVRLQQQPGWGDEPSWPVVRARVRQKPAPPGWVATARLTHATLDFAGEGQVTRPAAGHSAALPDETGTPAWVTALRHVLGVHIIGFGPDVTEVGKDMALHIPREILDRPRTHPAAYRAEFTVDVTRLDLVAALPLREGGRFDDGSYRFIVDGFVGREADFAVRTRVSSVGTTFDRHPRPVYTFHLRNRRRQEALPGNAHFTRQNVVYPILGSIHISGEVSGFTTSAQIINFFHFWYPQGEKPPAPAPKVDRAWLEEAELVIVKASYAGSVRRTLEIRDFPLTSPSTRASPLRN